VLNGKNNLVRYFAGASTVLKNQRMSINN